MKMSAVIEGPRFDLSYWTGRELAKEIQPLKQDNEPPRWNVPRLKFPRHGDSPAISQD